MLNQELMANDVSEFIVLVVLEQILSIVVMKLEIVDEQSFWQSRDVIPLRSSLNV